MKRILNKTVTSLLILMLLLVSCPMTIIKSNAEEVEKVEYENVADYILKTEDSTSCEWGAIRIENAIIKDFGDISNYTAASMISMENVDIGNVDGVEIPVSVKEINITGKLSGTLYLTKNTNLECLIFSEMEQGDLANAVIDIRGLDNIYTFEFDYIGTTKYLMNEKILMNDYSISIDEYDFTVDNITTNVYRFHIYDNLTHYFENELKWSYESIEDVEEIIFWERR